MSILDLIEKSNEKAVVTNDYTPLSRVIEVITEYFKGAEKFSVNSSLFTFNHYYDLMMLFSSHKPHGGSKPILEHLLAGDSSFYVDQPVVVAIAAIFGKDSINNDEYSSVISLWSHATMAYMTLIGNLKVVKKSDFEDGAPLLATKNELKEFDSKYFHKLYAPEIKICDMEVSLMRIRSLLFENGETELRLNSRDFVMTIYNYCKMREM